MSRQSSWLDEATSLVADASVWINLVATGRAEEILRSSPGELVITKTALGELENGRAKGRQTAAEVARLIELGLVREVTLSSADEAVFLGLVAGPTSLTLDDGEAATIAYALGTGAVALIDERKATALCVKHYPTLIVMSTTDLLLADPIASSFQANGLGECLFLALTVARMRVPDRHLAGVCDLLGPGRCRECRSLPTAWREGPAPATCQVRISHRKPG
jgi:predicted nucleic acid-binding protein